MTTTTPEGRTRVVTHIISTAEKYNDEIAKLAPRGVNPAHYTASLRLYLSSNQKLLECYPISIARVVLRVAQTGLELGVSCDLLPFKEVAQFNPRYNGLVELALASGVRAINADVVREHDFFEYQKGTEFFLRHRNSPEMGPIEFAYAIAEIKVGSFAFEVLNREQIDATRSEFSKSWWKNGKGEIIPLDTIPWYAKKTAIRRLSPMLPKNARFAAALAYAEESEEIPTGSFEIMPPAQAAADAAATGAEEGRAAAEVLL